MREHIDPSELQLATDVVYEYAGSCHTIQTTAPQRTDINGNGGLACHQVGCGSVYGQARSRIFPSMHVLQEGYVKGGVYKGGDVRFRCWRSNIQKCGIQYRNTTYDIAILNSGNTVLATSIATFPPALWYLLEAHIRSASSADSHTGYIAAYVDDDGTYTTPVVDYTGDNVTSGAVSDWNQIEFGGTSNARCDDGPDVNSITLLYNGGAGSFAPSAGDTITDGSTGATAVVTEVDGDATSGRLVLQEWNGTAFGNGNTITESGGSTTAAVYAPSADFLYGFEPNSWFIGNEHTIVVQPSIAAAGTYSQLSQSTPSTYNSELVDGIPPTTTDYVYTGTSGLKDSYAYGSTMTSTLPASSLVSSWGPIAVITIGATDLVGIAHVENTVRQGTVDYPLGVDIPMGSDADIAMSIVQTQPDGSGAWTYAALTSANFEAGAILKA